MQSPNLRNAGFCFLMKQVASCIYIAGHFSSWGCHFLSRKYYFLHFKQHLCLTLFKKELEAIWGAANGAPSCVVQTTAAWAVLRSGLWELTKCSSLLLIMCYLPEPGPCPQARIPCGFRPINLEQFHWTLFLVSVFHFQIDNWAKWSLATLPQPGAEQQRVPAMGTPGWEPRIDPGDVTPGSCPHVSMWNKFIRSPS